MKLKDLKNCLKSQSIGQSEIRNGHKNSYMRNKFNQRSAPSYTPLHPLVTTPENNQWVCQGEKAIPPQI